MKRLLCRSFALFGLFASVAIGACSVIGPEAPNVTSDRGSVRDLPVETEASSDLARRRACRRDADCVPASCCHPASCVPRSQRPDCSGVLCTNECRPGTLDCGQGHCECQAGSCAAIID